jgi:hypothetical protein
MVRRLILALTVVAVMVGALVAGSAATVVVGGLEVSSGTQTAVAQPGAPTYRGPYETAFYVSSGGYRYAWVYRWCYNPSIQGGWYIDWVNWYWGSLANGPGNYLAGPGYTPGFQYSVPYIQQ